MRKTKVELAEIEADLEYWRELAKLVGWQVYGFNSRHSASFVTNKLSRPMVHPLEVLCFPRSEPNSFIEVTAAQCDQLVAAIKKGYNGNTQVSPKKAVKRAYSRASR